MVRTLTLAIPFVICSSVFSQHGSQQSSDPKMPMYVAPAGDDGQQAIASFTSAEGPAADLIAAAPAV